MGFLGQGFSNCGSHKTTWQQLNDTHTVPRAGRYTRLIMNVFISNILVGLEIDYTCLGGSWNGKVWEPLF